MIVLLYCIMLIYILSRCKLLTLEQLLFIEISEAWKRDVELVEIPIVVQHVVLLLFNEEIPLANDVRVVDHPRVDPLEF